MVEFKRKELMESQIENFERIYQNVNFFVWLLWGLVTIVSLVAMYFFSITLGLWFLAFATFASAIYYFILSFIKERVHIGYYQRIKKIQVLLTKDGIVAKEFFKDQEKDYLVAYDTIYKILQYKNYAIIKLINEGSITLPYEKASEEFFATLKGKIKEKYKICF